VLSFRAMSRIDPVVFFGTPEFAVPTLAALVAAGRSPALVVTQPSKPAGRGQRSQDPPVARWARERGLTVVQPERVRQPEFLERMKELRPAAAVVVAFGQIFPKALLEIPEHGCINVHASLLPKYRGASPIQAAVAEGETRTGITTMLMEEGLDSGPILLQEETEIGPEETAGELAPRLAALGGDLLVRTLERLEEGTLAPRPQPAEGVTYAPRLTRESGRVDWTLPARAIADRGRAYTPWPGLTAILKGEPVKLVRVRVLEGGPADAGPGTFLGLRDGALAVACGDGSLLGVEELQRPARRALKAADFVNGERLHAGESFG
jgi:methionyl-tRNA formyltransferase